MNKKILEQAIKLAKDARQGDPDVGDIFWFPDNNQIRLVYVGKKQCPSHLGEAVSPFYFPSSMQDGIGFESAEDLINDDEVGKLSVPDGWCGWEEAVKI